MKFRESSPKHCCEGRRWKRPKNMKGTKDCQIYNLGKLEIEECFLFSWEAL